MKEQRLIVEGRAFKTLTVYRLEHERHKVRALFRQLLEQEFSGTTGKGKPYLAFVEPVQKATSLILTFRFPAVDMRTLATRLSLRKVFLTYSDAYDALRVAFHHAQTEEEFGRAIGIMKEEIAAMRQEGLVAED